MALNLSNINYSGKELGLQIIRDVYANSLLLNKVGINTLMSYKSKFVWHDVTTNVIINDGSPICPTFDSSSILNQNNGELCEYHASGTINHDALIGTYRELNYVPGVLKERVAQDAELFSALMTMIQESINVQQDNKWLNDSYVYNCQNGLFEQIRTGLYTATNTIQRPVPSSQKLVAASINAGNVQSELRKVINAMPGKYRYGLQTSIFGKPVILVGYNVSDALHESYTYTAPQASAGGFGPDADYLSYGGYAIIPMENFADNQILMGGPNNYNVVFDSMSDMFDMVVADGLQDFSLCKQFKWRLDYRTAIFFAEGEGIVLYE